MKLGKETHCEQTLGFPFRLSGRSLGGMDELGDYEALRIRHQRIAEPATMLSTEGPRLVQLLVFRDVGRLVRVDISGEMQLITEAPNLIAGLVDPVESYRLK